MSLEELRGRPMAFVDDLEAPGLSDADRHHLERSLRVRDGSEVTVSDGRGRWRLVLFGPDLTPGGPIVIEPPPAKSLTIAFAPVKGDRSDFVVQKLTELGINTIVPITSTRSVVRWDHAKAEKNQLRQLRIAREAAMQSRNPWLPAVEALTPLAEFLSDRPSAVLADPAGRGLTENDQLIVIGPEGGFAPEELIDRDPVRLPGRILRTETAAIAAAVLALDRQ